MRRLLITRMDAYGKSTEEIHDIGRQFERDALINLIKKEYGEDYYETGKVGEIVRLIRSQNHASEG